MSSCLLYQIKFWIVKEVNKNINFEKGFYASKRVFIIKDIVLSIWSIARVYLLQTILVFLARLCQSFSHCSKLFPRNCPALIMLIWFDWLYASITSVVSISCRLSIIWLNRYLKSFTLIFGLVQSWFEINLHIKFHPGSIKLDYFYGTNWRGIAPYTIDAFIILQDCLILIWDILLYSGCCGKISRLIDLTLALACTMLATHNTYRTRIYVENNLKRLVD